MKYELVNWVYRPTHIMQHLVQVQMEQYSTRAILRWSWSAGN